MARPAVTPPEVASYLGALLRDARVRASELAATEPQLAGVADISEELRLFSILVVLTRIGPVSQQWLADYLRINRSVMVKLIDVLEERGSVERARRPQDRRSYALTVTAGGSAELKSLARSFVSLGRKVTAPLSREERDRLVGLLGRLAAAHFSPEPPPELKECPVWLITSAHQAMEVLGDERLAPLGLTVRQYVSLAVLSGTACSQTDLAGEMGIGTAATVDLVDSLERLGAVERVRSSTDRRSYALEVSHAGNELREGAKRVLREATAEFTRELDAAENAELLGLLERLGRAHSLCSTSDQSGSVTNDPRSPVATSRLGSG